MSVVNKGVVCGQAAGAQAEAIGIRSAMRQTSNGFRWPPSRPINVPEPLCVFR
jgi:hypothetical protein